MENNNEEIKKVKEAKQTNYNAIIMTVLLILVIGMTSFIINDKFLTEPKSTECNCPKCVTPVPTQTPTPTATPESTPKPTTKYNTIQDYVNEWKNNGTDVKLINSVDQITINKTKITSEEEMKEYARLLVNSNLSLGLGIANKNVKDATKTEILELIMMTYVESPNCISQTVISQLADQLYDIKNFENKEYNAYIDGYYCPGGLGGMTGEGILKEEVTTEGDLYIYKFGIGSESVTKTMEVKFKKINDLYKLVYFG